MTVAHKELIIDKQVYNEILHSCPKVPPECGGILGMQQGIITSWYSDPCLTSLDRAVYTPNVTLLNQVIRMWATSGITFGGIYHSHPVNQPELSSADLEYIDKVFSALSPSITTLFFPLVLPGQDILFYRAQRCNEGISVNRVSIHFIERRKTNGKGTN